MTFNIRYASAFGVNSWPKRRAGVVQVIREQKPDLFGTQEGLHHQLLFMDKELPKYAWIGLGREGGAERTRRGARHASLRSHYAERRRSRVHRRRRQ